MAEGYEPKPYDGKRFVTTDYDFNITMGTDGTAHANIGSTTAGYTVVSFAVMPSNSAVSQVGVFANIYNNQIYVHGIGTANWQIWGKVRVLYQVP